MAVIHVSNINLCAAVGMGSLEEVVSFWGKDGRHRCQLLGQDDRLCPFGVRIEPIKSQGTVLSKDGLGSHSGIERGNKRDCVCPLDEETMD